MIGTFQKTLLEYVGSGKEIKYIANLLKLSKLRLTEEVEKLENLGYLGVWTSRGDKPVKTLIERGFQPWRSLYKLSKTRGLIENKQ